MAKKKSERKEGCSGKERDFEEEEGHIAIAPLHLYSFQSPRSFAREITLAENRNYDYAYYFCSPKGNLSRK